MFKGIKLRIMKGRKLDPFATVKLLQEHEDRITALEGGEVDSGNENETPTTEPTPTVYDLSFTINDGTAPVSGATVKIGSKTGTTGLAGGCTIKDVEAGTVSVEVSKEGFTTKTESITVDETHTRFTISLTATSP